MENPLYVSLVVTGIGMAMLFLALALLYGLMVLMTALIKDRPEATGRQEVAVPDADERVLRTRAAVVAVALARAELEMSAAASPAGGSGWGPWRQVHTQRLLDRSVRKRTVR
jgi:Na+-transporting methylmalonyl-CoA/oxaloacetate decarboxylase gamma subunit